MLAALGRDYIIQHVHGYMADKLDERRYRAYVTDAMMAIAENTARFNGGSQMSGRWVDQYKPVDNRSAEDIIQDIVTNAGLK